MERRQELGTPEGISESLTQMGTLALIFTSSIVVGSTFPVQPHVLSCFGAFVQSAAILISASLALFLWFTWLSTSSLHSALPPLPPPPPHQLHHHTTLTSIGAIFLIYEKSVT